MGNANVSTNGNGKENGIRKKVLKKAAMLATVASITGACAVGGQKPKESEALIGCIIMAVVSAVGIASSVATSVYETESAKNMQNQAIAEQKRQEEEARKQAEEEARRQAEEEARRQAEEAERARVEAALQSGTHNVRLQEQDEEQGKTIDISSADNSAVLEQQQQEALARARKRNSIKRPVAPPTDVNVGGFGVDDEEEVQENISSDILENEIDEEIISEDISDIQEEVYEEQETQEYEEVTDEESGDSSGSNIVRFSLDDLSFENNDGEDGVTNVKEELIAHGFGMVNEDYNDYVEIDENTLMSDEEAENHRLVKEGALTAEDIILLDFGIRNGTITEEVVNIMYESGEISDEYYEAAMELIFEIYEELSE